MRRIVVAFGVFVVVMGALAVVRWQLWSYGADTGTFTQIALNAFHGFYDTSERGSHFHVHWSPILITLYPVAALTHSGLSIQIAQIVLIGLGIFPFYAFLRRYADDGLAMLLSLTVLLYPPLLAVVFDEFHEIAFYPALVFALLWAIDAGRWRVAALSAALLLLVREEVLIVMAIFGLALAAASFRALRRPGAAARGILYFEPFEPRPALALGIALFVLGPAVFAAYFAVVAPSTGGWTASHFYSFAFAHGPLQVVEALFTQPGAVLQAIATPGRATYLLEAFGPLLFLGLASRWMFVVLPGVALVVLSSDASAWRMGSHYAAIWVPWLLVATADRAIRLAREPDSAVLARRLAIGIIAVCTIVLVAFDPLHPVHYLRPPYDDRSDAERAFDATPASASVFTHDEFFARMTGRRPALEHIWSEPDYAILATDFPNPGRFLPFIRLQVARGCYTVEREFGSVVVYRRTAAAGTSPGCRIAR